MAGVSQSIVYRLRKQVNEKLTKLPLKYYDKNTKGDILSRTTNDIENVSSVIGQAITQVITSIITIIGILAMMISIALRYIPTLFNETGKILKAQASRGVDFNEGKTYLLEHFFLYDKSIKEEFENFITSKYQDKFNKLICENLIPTNTTNLDFDLHHLI